MKQKVRYVVSNFNMEKNVNKAIEEEALKGWVLKQISAYGVLGAERAFLLFEKPEVGK